MDAKADADDLVSLENTVNDHIGAGGAAHAEATTSSAGFMAAADKQKLDNIESGAQVNQNAFAKVNDVEANDPSDELTITGGTGITVTTNPNTKEVIVTATGSSTPGPHGSSHTEHGADPIPAATTTEGGLMSADHVQMLEAHAARHAVGGPDEITPEMIGAVSQSDFSAHISETVQDGVHGMGSAAAQDYETGTWTPRLIVGGIVPSDITYQTQVGRYTRIGNRVIADFEIVLTNKGAASGNVRIGYLPFVAASAPRSHTLLTFRNVTLSSNMTSISAFTIGAGQTGIDVFQIGSDQDTIQLTTSNLKNNSGLYGQIIYTIGG